MAKIGVFDSGVGGLTVLKELALNFSTENFVYLGDTARLLYGSKSAETIRSYSEQIIDFLLSQKVDAIVIACNSASSQVPESSIKGVPIFNVITPGAKAAIQKTQSGRIGILGTRATVASQAYQMRIHDLLPSAQIFAQACPLFVPLAEEGWVDDPITNLIAFRYLQPLLLNQIDTLILGCTHYPLLQNSIQKACGSNVQLIDSGKALSEELLSAFAQEKLFHNTNSKLKIDFYLSDVSPHTRMLAEQIMDPIPLTHQNFPGFIA